MTAHFAPLLCSTRDVPHLLLARPLDEQEDLGARLDLLQGGLVQPILRVEQAALARLLFREARRDYGVLRAELRLTLSAMLGAAGCGRLHTLARRRAARLAEDRGVRARLGSEGVRALLRYATTRHDPACVAGPDRARVASAIVDLDFSLLALACVGHGLYRPAEGERTTWFVTSAHEALDVLRRRASEPAEEARSQPDRVAQRADWSRARWLTPLPLVESEW